jgi:hypothetical protein
VTTDQSEAVVAGAVQCAEPEEIEKQSSRAWQVGNGRHGGLLIEGVGNARLPYQKQRVIKLEVLACVAST